MARFGNAVPDHPVQVFGAHRTPRAQPLLHFALNLRTALHGVLGRLLLSRRQRVRVQHFLQACLRVRHAFFLRPERRFQRRDRRLRRRELLFLHNNLRLNPLLRRQRGLVFQVCAAILLQQFPFQRGRVIRTLRFHQRWPAFFLGPTHRFFHRGYKACDGLCDVRAEFFRMFSFVCRLLREGFDLLRNIGGVFLFGRDVALHVIDRRLYRRDQFSDGLFRVFDGLCGPGDGRVNRGHRTKKKSGMGIWGV